MIPDSTDSLAAVHRLKQEIDRLTEQQVESPEDRHLPRNDP